MALTKLWAHMVSVLVIVTGAASLMGGALVAAQGDEDETELPVMGAISVVAEQVYVLEAGASLEKRVALTAFDPGETLRTDAAGAALVTWFYDGTETVVTQDSRVTLNQFEGTSDQAYVIDLTLEQGHITAGLGSVASAAGGSFTVTAGDVSAKLVAGQMEVSLAADGSALVVVPYGSAEVSTGAGDPVTLVTGEAFAGGEKVAAGADGITPALEGLCMATANTNLVVRMYPSENSQRLGGVPSGQALWVRAGTDGNLWLQIGYATDPLQTDLYNFGWVYGPATTMGAGCGTIPRAALEAQIYGGGGIDAPAVEPGS